MPLIDHKRSDAPTMDLVQNESAFDRWCSEQAFATHQQHYKTLLEDLATVHAALADRSRLLAMKDHRISQAEKLASDRQDEITRLEGALAAALKKLSIEALEALDSEVADSREPLKADTKGQAYGYQFQQLLDRVNGHSKSIADLERKLGGVELAPGVEFTPAPGWKAEAARPFSHGDPFRSLFDRLGEMERKLEGYSSRLDYLESNRQA